MTPLRILSLGAGVQSTTVALMMIRGDIEPADHVVFADTGWEPKRVYEHLQWLEKLLAQTNMKFHRVSSGNLRDDLMRGSEEKKRVASLPYHTLDANGKRGMTRRQCTMEYKIEPLNRKARELAGIQPRKRYSEHLVTTVIGISSDEVERMRDASFAWMRNEYPLIDLGMTRVDCLQWCEQHGYPTPPRSACIGCPFKSRDEWRIVRDNETDWADAVQVDRHIRTQAFRQKTGLKSQLFLHKSAVPLEEADLRTPEEYGQFSLFNQECEGMCGL